jgi:hypothetical protein
MPSSQGDIKIKNSLKEKNLLVKFVQITPDPVAIGLSNLKLRKRHGWKNYYRTKCTPKDNQQLD